MIQCMKRGARLRWLSAFSSNKQRWENFKEKAKPYYEEYKPNPNQTKFGLAILGISILIYQLGQEYNQEISLEDMLSAIEKSSVDAITIYYFKRRGPEPEFEDPKRKIKQDVESNYVLYLQINGVNHFTAVSNIDWFLSQLKQIEANKSFKTKIYFQRKKSMIEATKDGLTIIAKLVTPLFIPIFLFRSSMAMVFKNKVLNQMENLTRPNVKFTDIAGLGNAKIQVSELVDFLKAPQKYKNIGAKVPKGALLAGPPGTGKTMLAKACSGEANVPFFSVSGSQFVELFAGMGAKRVRDLFKNAKAETPAIIFIDEIDAIGRKRQDKFGGANDERASTLNQLLVQMDGFSTSDDIIVLAATNRKQMLDSALIRPGRFDRIVEIELPDLKGRQEILQIYLSKIKLSPQQNLQEYAKRIATLTFGFSGADLANLCNQAAILAVRKQKAYVEPSDFESASDRVLAGLEQSMVLSKQEKRKVAYHECGHAVTSWFLEGAAPLLKITIIPRSKGSLGFAQYLPNESTLATKEELLDQLCVILGGRTAEQIFFKQVSNGAADDLQKVRNLARSIIVTYGMGKKHQNYAPVKTDGHNIYSDATSTEIDKQVMQLIEECTMRTRQIINKYRDKIGALAEAVLQKESLNHRQIREILGERPFESRQNYREFVEGLQRNEMRVDWL